MSRMSSEDYYKDYVKNVNWRLLEILIMLKMVIWELLEILIILLMLIV